MLLCKPLLVVGYFSVPLEQLMFKMVFFQDGDDRPVPALSMEIFSTKGYPKMAKLGNKVTKYKTAMWTEAGWLLLWVRGGFF